MTCRELIEFIAEYLDGTLPAAERAAFERHLAVCASCRAYLASYETTIRAVKSLADESAADEMPADLIDAIIKARRRS
jgi:anti-sigma factor RsiW